MNGLLTWLGALPWVLATALVAWSISTRRHNVGLVDIFWPLFLLVAALSFRFTSQSDTLRSAVILLLLGIWALRLAAHLAVRNWNAPEDHRYQAIRARNEPGFAWKSLYLVFGLQALLAMVVATPLLGAISSTMRWNALDALGAAVAATGILLESVADAQLASFRRNAATRDQVLDRGLWRYSRHPNYFGEFCVWWGFFLMALGAGAWWTVVSPLLMSVLLLRVSGVALLERDISLRRPGYAQYARRTNSFFPGPRRPA